MKITFKLYATLQDRLPSSAVDNAVELEVGNETTLHELIDKFGVKREQAHLVLINGRYCDHEERDRVSVLQEGDVVAVWPPVAGG